MPILEVEHIEKSFENTEVLKDISFTLEKVRYYRLSVLPEAARQHCSDA